MNLHSLPAAASFPSLSFTSPSPPLPSGALLLPLGFGTPSKGINTLRFLFQLSAGLLHPAVRVLSPALLSFLLS